jgi:hypothetical protein
MFRSSFRAGMITDTAGLSWLVGGIRRTRNINKQAGVEAAK